MPFTLSQYALVSLILFASSVVQGAVGFASGLFGIPLLVLTGIPLPDAVAMGLSASAVQNCIAAWQLRRDIDFRATLRPTLIRFAWLPVGVWALHVIGEGHRKAAAQALADRVSKTWATFARNGNPANDAIPTWPAYTAERRATMLFDDACRVVDDPDGEVRPLWSKVATG